MQRSITDIHMGFLLENLLSINFEREYIIVFDEYLKLRHKLEKNIVNEFHNSEFIQSFSCDFSLQGERVFHVNFCVLVCD